MRVHILHLKEQKPLHKHQCRELVWEWELKLDQ